jgi:hypothetical protein
LLAVCIGPVLERVLAPAAAPPPAPKVHSQPVRTARAARAAVRP